MKIGDKVDGYKITDFIAAGSFGKVYKITDKNGKTKALKIPVKNEKRDGQKNIIAEYNVYKDISNEARGIPNVELVYHGKKKMLMMNLFGDSLETIFKNNNKKFELKTVVLLTIQMLGILKFIHYKGYLHKDIKTDNFVVDIENPNKIYLIDYGLASEYIIDDDYHIPFSKHVNFCGTQRYASIAAHSFHEQSRKDDLESMFYVLIYFFNGKLPWQDIKSTNSNKKEKIKKIGQLKKDTALYPKEFCKGLPKQFLILYKYILNLKFQDKPHYTSLIRMFKELYTELGYTDNELFNRK